jgi:homoserine dehydrogenase
VTHETTEAAVRRAVDGITKDGHLTDKAQVIRIERAD